MKRLLKRVYKEDPEYKGRFVIAQLVYNKANEQTDIMRTIKNYFFEISDEETQRIKNMVEGK